MNKKKWKAKQGIPREVYFAKIAEEFGEVARELTEWQELSRGPRNESLLLRMEKNNKRFVDELEHLEFIARQTRKSFELMFEEQEKPVKKKVKTTKKKS